MILPAFISIGLLGQNHPITWFFLVWFCISCGITCAGLMDFTFQADEHNSKLDRISSKKRMLFAIREGTPVPILVINDVKNKVLGSIRATFNDEMEITYQDREVDLN